MTVGTLNGSLQQTNLTADGVLYADSTGLIKSTSAGTSTQVLTSNGPGVAPTFQAAGGGGAGNPSFSAYASSASSIYGGGASYVTAIFDTIVTNVGSAYSSGTNMFTAPKNGIYQFCFLWGAGSLDATNDLIIMTFNAAGNRYFVLQLPAFVVSSSGSIRFSSSITIPLSVSDNVYCEVFVSGNVCANYFGVGSSLFSGTFIG